MKKILLASMVLGAAALVSACGGGDDDNTPPVTQQVPSSVNMSVASFVAYLMVLVGVSDDTLSPVNVTNITPATDDMASATALE